MSRSDLRKVRPAATRAVCLPLALGVFVSSLVGGCNNAVQGGASGAGIGALSGLAIGSLSGNAGKGAVIGAVAGGVGGAVLGDQNRRASERSSAGQPGQGNAVPGNSPSGANASLSQADRDRLTLARFARSWQVQGWETIEGQRRLVSGTATGSVENSFFIRLTTSMRADQNGAASNGNIVFASEPGRGMTMNGHFDTAPSPMTFQGSLSSDGNVLTFNEIAPSAERRVVIRFLSDSQWVADVSSLSNNAPLSSFTFTATN